MKPLLDVQKKVKSKLEKVKVGAFFMEAGTGKTRPVIELVNDLKPDYILYLAPYQCINTVNQKEGTLYEINKWGGGVKCNFDLIGIETIQNSDRVYLDCYNKINQSQRAVIVVDESIKIKNIDAKRTKRIIELSKMVEYKFILNGTPITRNLLDLYSQMHFLSPSILNMSISDFKNNFCEYKKLTIRKPNSYKNYSKEWIVQYHNLDYLYELIRPYIFQSELNLDISLQEIKIDYKLSSEEKKEHKRVMEEVLSEDWLMLKPNFFLMLTQKLQNNYSRNLEKFEITKKILKDFPNTLIVAKYIKTQNELKKQFPKARVLSWQKNAFGLNMQDYNRMILFDPNIIQK